MPVWVRLAALTVALLQVVHACANTRSRRASQLIKLIGGESGCSLVCTSSGSSLAEAGVSAEGAMTC
jgi:hypothetical protein